jgi:hypothetical protein
MDPAGVFATSYQRDQALIRTRKQFAALIASCVLVLVPQLLGPRLVSMGSVMLITAIVVVGLQINTGYAGQVNLGPGRVHGRGRLRAARVRHQDRPAVLDHDSPGGHRGGRVRVHLRSVGGAHQGLLPRADHDRGAVPVPLPRAESADELAGRLQRHEPGTGDVLRHPAGR